MFMSSQSECHEQTWLYSASVALVSSPLNDNLLSLTASSDPHIWPLIEKSLFAMFGDLQRHVTVAFMLAESSTSPQCLLWTLMHRWLVWWFFIIFFILTECQYILLFLKALGLKVESQSSLPLHPKMLFSEWVQARCLTSQWRCSHQDTRLYASPDRYKGCKSGSSCYAICTNLTNWTSLCQCEARQLFFILALFVLIQSVVSVLRIPGSERRARPAWSGATRRSRTRGATR